MKTTALKNDTNPKDDSNLTEGRDNEKNIKARLSNYKVTELER